MTQHNRMTRRNFLKGSAGIGGGVALAGFASAFGLQSAQAAHNRNDDIPTIVALAATAETLAATSYYNTILNNPLGFSDQTLLYLKYAMVSELYHLEILQSLGGKSLTDKFFVPEKFLSDKGTNVATFMAAETAFVGAYLAATRRFAELGDPRLAATAAQFAGTEVEHLALTRQAGGFLPNPNGLPAPIYYNVSDAVPVLGPFLQGASGFIGPVAFPGADAIRKLAGVEVIKVATFTQVF